GDRLEAVMSGKIGVARIKERLLASGMAQDADFEVVDHDFLRDAAKELEGMTMAGQEVVHGLGEGELDIEHRAVTEHHEEEGEPAAARTHWDRAVLAPVHLSAFSRGKLQHEKGRFADRTDQPHIVLEDAISASIAL